MPGKKARKTKKPDRAVKKSKPAIQQKSTKSAASATFAPVFSALRDVMAGFENELHVVSDEPRKYYVVTKALSWKGGPMFFGAVIWGKAYVSYHLMPLYLFPELASKISPELKRRMQGKTCFNFRQPEDGLIAELNDLTKAGLEQYRAKSLL